MNVKSEDAKPRDSNFMHAAAITERSRLDARRWEVQALLSFGAATTSKWSTIEIAFLKLKMASSKDAAQEKNARGIPKAPFIVSLDVTIDYRALSIERLRLMLQNT